MKRKGLSDDERKGRELASLRRAKGIKGAWVAGQIGISPAYLCNLEKGKRPWKVGFEERFRAAIGVA